ncbi:isochorismatase domain-containing protein [Dacryopinax primogenitus]|uniref:Isochorismatase domain-containing protein n=1 Tax=Dacryopinax primogenitus (strain DJM 731) TaxID=1858805 RepID=M5GFN9_DACPD|nr:isochorismatase domain-containing protein [Dacryopinax primogenitus]EJU06477.1 isochorismatase domain-containing protein [Dacryopinax primogenitus]
MAAAAAKIVAARTAFLLCDLQTAFRTAIYSFDDVEATAGKMLRAAKIFEIPVLLTEQNPKALGTTVATLPLEALHDSKLLHGPWPKKKFSMVIPELQACLKERGVQDVVLFGIESHICVLQTALDLLRESYSVHVLADGISSCNKGERSIAISTMREAGARVTTSESVLYQLMEDASDPRFKTFVTLIKDEKARTQQTSANLLEDL